MKQDRTRRTARRGWGIPIAAVLMALGFVWALLWQTQLVLGPGTVVAVIALLLVLPALALIVASKIDQRAGR